MAKLVTQTLRQANEQRQNKFDLVQALSPSTKLQNSSRKITQHFILFLHIEALICF